MKKRFFPILALAVVTLSLLAAPTASAIVLVTCEDCLPLPIRISCWAQSGSCEGQIVTCFQWFNGCSGLHVPEGILAPEEAFLLSLEAQAVIEQFDGADEGEVTP